MKNQNTFRPKFGSLVLTFLLLALTLLCAFPTASKAQDVYVVGASGTLQRFDSSTGNAAGFGNSNAGAYLQGIAISGNTLYVSDVTNHSIDTFNAATGSEVKAGFITGLSNPYGIALSGTNLYVVNNTGNTIGLYNASTGAAINTAFINGLGSPAGLAIGTNGTIFVANVAARDVSEYASDGTLINFDFITFGGRQPVGLFLSGGDLYVSIAGTGVSVGKYDATTGAAIAGFISPTNLNPPALAVVGNALYVANSSANEVGKYDATTGAVINLNAFPTVAGNADGIVEAIPEPGTWSMAFAGFGLLGCMQYFRRARRA